MLVLHRGRRRMAEALLKAELGLLRWSLRTRQRGACRIAFLWYGRHRVGSRTIHLVVCDCAGIDEAGGIIHPVLR